MNLSPEQLRAIIEAVASHVQLPWWYWVLPSVVAFLFSGVGGLIGSYLKVKGERIARTEDLKPLLEEQRQTTRTQEEIKAAISNQVWAAQNAWTLKREIYFDLLRALTEVQFCLHQLAFLSQRTESGAKAFIDEYRDSLSGRMNALRHAAAVAPVIVSREAMEALGALVEVWSAQDNLMPHVDYRALRGQVGMTLREVTTQARVDLGLQSTQGADEPIAPRGGSDRGPTR